jgi:hypothetical protein
MSHRSIFIVSILSAGTSLVQAQAIIEFGAAAGRAGAAGAGANVGKSIADVFGKVTQSLSSAGKVDEAVKPGSVPAATTAPATAATPERPIPPDLSALVVGMDRGDMLKKVGKPSMSIEGVESATQVETCWYRTGSDSVTVTLREGKVATIVVAENLPAKEALAPVHDSLSH